MAHPLQALRDVMAEYHIDAYLIPTADFHGSEYVGAHFACREYLSGFTGSAGTLLVFANWAGLWTDGRYFLQAAQQLEGSGIRAVVDATRDLLVNVLPYKPFLIKPNNHELSEITGVRLTNDKEIAAAAHMMQDKGARNVLVSMAGDGALLLDEHGTVYRIGCPRGKVVNSVGAGDSMVAGFVAGYQQSGGDYEAALRLGTACGSATAFSLGLATKADIDALLTTM